MGERSWGGGRYGLGRTKMVGDGGLFLEVAGMV